MTSKAENKTEPTAVAKTTEQTLREAGLGAETKRLHTLVGKATRLGLQSEETRGESIWLLCWLWLASPKGTTKASMVTLYNVAQGATYDADSKRWTAADGGRIAHASEVSNGVKALVAKFGEDTAPSWADAWRYVSEELEGMSVTAWYESQKPPSSSERSGKGAKGGKGAKAPDADSPDAVADAIFAIISQAKTIGMEAANVATLVTTTIAKVYA